MSYSCKSYCLILGPFAPCQHTANIYLRARGATSKAWPSRCSYTEYPTPHPTPRLPSSRAPNFYMLLTWLLVSVNGRRRYGNTSFQLLWIKPLSQRRSISDYAAGVKSRNRITWGLVYQDTHATAATERNLANPKSRDIQSSDQKKIHRIPTAQRVSLRKEGRKELGLIVILGVGVGMHARRRAGIADFIRPFMNIQCIEDSYGINAINAIQNRERYVPTFTFGHTLHDIPLKDRSNHSGFWCAAIIEFKLRVRSQRWCLVVGFASSPQTRCCGGGKKLPLLGHSGKGQNGKPLSAGTKLGSGGAVAQTVGYGKLVPSNK
ncbi:hypothetical protein B0H16DRAFT_1702795 [Mycena metata]|uniref:Uncharacterized protein n=1 Tax=Mycena metata TaxID=1033252 RepID=A0AAD7MDS7_9AGAR|nr:hypothetical protein B0H16DRAFT_1702795 [Mycena metata]